MAIPGSKANPGDVISLGPLGSELTMDQVVPLVKTGELEVFQVVVPSGKAVPSHEFSREVVVQCLEGRVRLVSSAQTRDLAAGQLLYYSSEEPFSILGLENSSLLIMAAMRKTGKNVELIG